MLMQKVQNKLKRGWLNVKNGLASALLVTLFTALTIGIVALIPVILAVIISIALVIAFKFVYAQYSRDKKKAVKKDPFS